MQMVIIMREIGFKTRQIIMALTFIQMVQNMQANGLRINSKETELKRGMLGLCIKGTTRMAKNMVLRIIFLENIINYIFNDLKIFFKIIYILYKLQR